MDPLLTPTTLAIVTSLGTNYFTHFTADKVQQFFATAFKLKPSLEKDLLNAKTSIEIEKIFKEATGVIDANAGSGILNIDKALLEAVRGIRLDHAHGQVVMNNTTLKSQVIQTGGSEYSTGTTNLLGGTTLKTDGTEISIGHGASITLSGGAKITQS